MAVIQSELGRYIKAGATAYFLVNTSDIRPVAMTTRAVMDIAWGGVPDGGDTALLSPVGHGGIRREVRGCSGGRLQGVLCRAFAARADGAAGIDVRGQCAAAAAEL